MDLHWFGMTLLPSQVQTANPILILIFIPLVNYLIYPLMDRFFTLTPLRKIGIGLFLTAGSYVIIWYIQKMIDAGGRPGVNWQFLAYIILTLGETMVSITGLEFSYTQAPNKMKSAVMALWLFTVSMGNFFTAAVNYLHSQCRRHSEDERPAILPLFRRAHVRRGGDFRRLRDVLSRENLPAIAGTDPRRTGHRAMLSSGAPT